MATDNHPLDGTPTRQYQAAELALAPVRALSSCQANDYLKE
jgi:hypothetical protein